jgi:hypothetical protein
VSHAQSAGQSVVTAQPQFRLGRQTWPLAEVVQSSQFWPVGPQLSVAFPVTHVPPVEQQPTLHPVTPGPEQDVEHWWVVVLHACPGEQSAATLHPHAPAGRHAWPAPLVEQSTHAVPLAPQTLGLVPAWHVPLGVPAQHPVGHGCDALHVKVQMPPLQPCAPAAQSPTTLQPH